MLCFFNMFHRYLEAMIFSFKTKTYVLSVSILGGQHVVISLVSVMITEVQVFCSGAFSMNSLNDFNGGIMCIGGPQALKTLEIPVRK